jgi:hypothetical protein
LPLVVLEGGRGEEGIDALEQWKMDFKEDW